MQVVAAIQELRAAGIDRVVVAFGVFDGLHRGHQQIIGALMRQARRTGAVPAVATFEPHPRAVLQPDSAPQLLTTLRQKLALLERSGVQAVVLLPFSREMADLGPRPFLERYLLRTGVRVEGICVGAAWRFGAQGEGDVPFLDAVGQEAGFRVVSVPDFRLYGKTVSSTRIRDAIARGRVRHAARLLGRPYAVAGDVVRGKGVGRKLFGYPTANVVNPNVLMPRCGVYAARTQLVSATAETLGGIAYVGTAPTMPEQQKAASAMPVLEMHMFDVDLCLYGETIDVQFIRFIRPDRRFPDTEALRQQMHGDAAKAREILSAHRD